MEKGEREKGEERKDNLDFFFPTLSECCRTHSPIRCYAAVHEHKRTEGVIQFIWRGNYCLFNFGGPILLFFFSSKPPPSKSSPVGSSFLNCLCNVYHT